MKVKSVCAALVAVLSGCAGDGGASPGAAPSACPTAPACGGDITGTWSLASTCLALDLSSFTDGCPGARAFAQGDQLTGTITYDAAMTYTLVSALSGSVAVEYPASCLTPPDGVEVTCDQLAAALEAPGRYQSVACLANGAACDCTIALTPQTFRGTGTYSIDGDVLLAGTADESDYCVHGDGTATLGAHPGSPVMGHQGLTASALTLTKQ